MSDSADRRKTPKRITATYLHNSGLYYLQRFSASTAQFRRVMLRKIDKSCHVHTDQDRQAATALLEETIETFTRSGLLNDGVYTAAAVTSLRRRGESARSIRARLAAKGLPPELVDHALQAAASGVDVDADLIAAVRFAQRKRLGPFAHGKAIDGDKALGVFGRGGFSYRQAKEVLAMDMDIANALLRKI